MRILIVCTGNLCRSPMAEHLLKRSLATLLKAPVEGLPKLGWVVESAGTHAYDGAEMPADARIALMELGLHGVSHKSRLLRASFLAAADVAYAAAKEHFELMKSLHQPSAGKLRMLDPNADIEDPMGQGIDSFRYVAAELAVRAEAIAKELTKPRK